MENDQKQRDLQFDFISSPMMFNDLFRKIQLPSIGSSDKLTSSQSTETSKDLSLSFQAQKSLTEVRAPEQPAVSSTPSFNQVSVYSGPLHNDRMATADEQSTASLADRLANARMMQKSGYTWDPAGSCAKIRLGDGAILQNLYPSHSHVKLRTGAVERIDAYCQRMINDEELLREITMIKAYEYNQWARTRALNAKDYENNKPVPIEKIESKSTQPSWNTLKPMNASLINLGAKNRIFSYDDLAAKFAQPKFLKRMGFIDNETDYNPKGYSLNDDCCESPPTSEYSPTATSSKKISAGPMQVVQTSTKEENIPPEEAQEESEELSSDDEEYHNDMKDEALLQVPPERIPSSKRSSRQKLAIYKDDFVIGSKSPASQTSQLVADEQQYLKSESDKMTVPLSTVKIVDNLFHQNRGENFASTERKSRNGSFQSRPIRKDSMKLEIPTKLHRVDKSFVRFSQPVCLCPKLSKETLNSFYSPTMQKYLSNQTNGFIRCQLHSHTRHSRSREKIVLKSL